MSREDMLVEYMAPVTRHELGTPSLPVGMRRVRFVYTVADPFAVTVAVSTGSDSWAEWTFARDLLVDGLTRGVGLGAVHVCPAPHEPGDKVAIIVRPHPGTGYELVVCRAQLEDALARMEILVPSGVESERIAWDRELAALIGGDPR